MLVEDPVLRIGLRLIFQSWNFGFFSIPIFSHMLMEREEKKENKKKRTRVYRDKTQGVMCKDTVDPLKAHEHNKPSA